jgi:hypothetical protein
MQTLVIRVANRVDQQVDYDIMLHRVEPSAPDGHVLVESGVLSATQVDNTATTIASLLDPAGAGPNAEEMGRILYGLLTSTDAGRRWAELCGTLDTIATVSMRTYLDFEPAEIAELPWELMLAGDGPVFLGKAHRVLRGRPEAVADPAPAVPFTLPIRVLIVLCRQEDSRDEPINAANEADGVYAGLRTQPGIWQIEVLRGPSKLELIRRLDDFAPHILHVVGNRARSDSQQFEVVTHPGRSWSLAVGDVLCTNPDSPTPPQLLILDACVASQAMPPVHLRQLGTRAVVTMQPRIHSAHAENLTLTFYKELAERGSLEEAIRSMRIIFKSKDSQAGEWGKAVLTVYGPPADVIPDDLRTLSQRAGELRSSIYFEDTARQVDRICERMKVWGKESGHPDKKLIVVDGPAGSGKTQLVRSCMLTWQLRGCRTVLVDMEEAQTDTSERPRDNLDALAALLHLCRRLEGKLEIWQNEPGTSYRGHLDDLVNLIESIKAVNRKEGRRDGEPHDEQFIKLHEILEAITQEENLLLIVDHIEKITEDERRPFSDRIIRPIARGVWNGRRLDRLYGLFAITTEALMTEASGRNSIWQSLDGGSIDRVELGYFLRRDTRVLGRELGARMGWLEPKWHRLVEDVYGRSGDLKPKVLTMLVQIYKEVNGGTVIDDDTAD